MGAQERQDRQPPQVQPVTWRSAQTVRLSKFSSDQPIPLQPSVSRRSPVMKLWWPSAWLRQRICVAAVQPSTSASVAAAQLATAPPLFSGRTIPASAQASAMPCYGHAAAQLTAAGRTAAAANRLHATTAYLCVTVHLHGSARHCRCHAAGSGTDYRTFSRLTAAGIRYPDPPDKLAHVHCRP